MRARLVTEENKKWWTLAAVSVGLFMIMLDNTVVNVALPSIQRDLGVGLSELEWIVSGYALTFAALMLIGGKLADAYGRRLIFVTGIVVFTLASLLCGLATSGDMLIASRILQGAGAALMNPATLSIIAATFPPRQRGTAIGIWAGVSALALAIGPLVGGLLTEHASWNWIFFVNVPVGILGVVASFFLIDESRDPTHERLDLPGLATSAIGLFALTYGLIEANTYGWGPRASWVRSSSPPWRSSASCCSSATSGHRCSTSPSSATGPMWAPTSSRCSCARDVRRLLLRLPVRAEHPRLLRGPGRGVLPSHDHPRDHRGADRGAGLRPVRLTRADDGGNAAPRVPAPLLQPARPGGDVLDAPARPRPGRRRHVDDDDAERGRGDAGRAGREGRCRLGRPERVPPGRRLDRHRVDGRDHGGAAHEPPTAASFLRGFERALFIAAAIAFVGAIVAAVLVRPHDRSRDAEERVRPAEAA